MLITSIFPFSHNVFRWLVLRVVKIGGMRGKESNLSHLFQYLLQPRISLEFFTEWSNPEQNLTGQGNSAGTGGNSKVNQRSHSPQADSSLQVQAASPDSNIPGSRSDI